VGGEPLFIARGKGAKIWDVDGRELIDYVGSWGPLIVGHAHEEVLEAIARAAADGTSFGAPTEREVEFAELICRALPSIEKVRLGGYRGEGVREHGLRAAAREVARGAARAHREARDGADLRRGDDRIPCRVGRGAAPLRHHAGPHVPREDRRWRAAARGVRRI